MTHATRNTTTGLDFENKVKIKCKGIDISKHNLYKYLTQRNIDWENILSRKLLPDEAYWDEETKTLSVFEKNFSNAKVLLMKSRKLVLSNFGSFQKLERFWEQIKLLILIYFLLGFQSLNIKIC